MTNKTFLAFKSGFFGKKARCTGFVAALLVVAISFPALSLDPKLPPGKNFNLSPFKLQTLNQNLAFFEMASDSLVKGYTSKYFYTDTTDGSMVFSTPENGGTTSGSSYPRNELRQTSAGANWKLTDTTTKILTASCKVTKAPATVVIGQVHGSNNNSELVELEWMGNSAGNCKVSAMFQTNDAAGSNYFVQLASGLSLGSLVTYELKMKGGVLSVTVNGKTGIQTYTTQYYGTTDGYYFKAGNYLQYSSSSATVSEVHFYTLTVLGASIPTNITAGNTLSELRLQPNSASWVPRLGMGNQSFSRPNAVFNALGKRMAHSISGRTAPAGLYFVKPGSVIK
jgi:hypothetical protein